MSLIVQQHKFVPSPIILSETGQRYDWANRRWLLLYKQIPLCDLETYRLLFFPYLVSSTKISPELASSVLYVSERCNFLTRSNGPSQATSTVLFAPSPMDAILFVVSIFSINGFDTNSIIQSVYYTCIKFNYYRNSIENLVTLSSLHLFFIVFLPSTCNS
jgi:hypothetical protein